MKTSTQKPIQSPVVYFHDLAYVHVMNTTKILLM